VNIKNSLDTFWQRMKHTESGCWEWTGARAPKGYGAIRIRGKTHRTHRVAYELTYGPIPVDRIVCHRCDNPPCCNPEHLYLGTYADNAADCVSKGRYTPHTRKGESNHLSKLTERDVMDIRTLYARGGISYSELAQQYGVAKTAIGAIIRRETWPDVSEVRP
jgi:hypothetical protein